MLPTPSDRRHDAARHIQHLARTRRVRRAARVLAKLPIELREYTVQISCKSSALQCASLRASVARTVMARFSRSGVSLGEALCRSKSWEDADLGAHLCELRKAFMLATKCHEVLSLSAISDMLNTVLYYIARCRYDATGDWMRCQVAMCAFTRAVLAARGTEERRDAASSMGLKSMTESTRAEIMAAHVRECECASECA